MDILFLLLMISLPLLAQLYVSATFSKYSDVKSASGLTAEQVARMILDQNGLQHIMVEKIPGKLTDHYSPKEDIVRLSESVYGKTSISAIGVAAHECGHACQHAEDYGPIIVRTSIVPFVSICSRLWYIVFVIGILIIDVFPYLTYIGIAMFGMVVLFQAVTLPTEIDASDRALKILEAEGILNISEIPQAKKVLFAAAMTYVTALATSLMQLIRLLLRVKHD